MNSSDISGTFFILLMFVLFYLINYVYIQAAEIKKNWILYRCNPMIMAMASFFGHDSEKTFMDCTKNIQENSMGKFLDPIHGNMGILGETNKVLGDAIQNTRGVISNVRGFSGDIFGMVFGVIINVFVEMEKLVLNVEDLFSKLFGMMASFIYILNGTVFSMESAWAGPPGEAVRTLLCFAPETKIRLKNGELIQMKDLKLNSILKNGTRVISVMKISNLNDNGNVDNEFFEMVGEDNEKIYVTGSHLVYDKDLRKYIYVKDSKDSKKSNKKSEDLACLITTDHTIPIGKHIFHDWEDNN
jgi:hypothetical protein